MRRNALDISSRSKSVSANRERRGGLGRPPSVFSWAGCYVGGNGGWIGGLSRSDFAPSGNYLNAPGAAAPPNIAGTGDFPANIAALSNSYTGHNSGVEIGGQIGCNWQSGAWVYGGEADVQWSSLKDTSDAAFAAFTNAGNPAFTNAAHTEHV